MFGFNKSEDVSKLTDEELWNKLKENNDRIAAITLNGAKQKFKGELNKLSKETEKLESEYYTREAKK